MITSTQFSNNIATSRTKNVFCGFSDVYVINSMFRSAVYTNPENIVQYENTTGSYFYIIEDSNVIIKDSSFYDGLAHFGGAIYISGEAVVSIENSVFLKNYAYMNGGAIYASRYSKVLIFGKSQFGNNKAFNFGDDIYAANTKNSLVIQSVSFTNPTAKSSIYAESVAIEIYNTKM